jgi:hypothetical protein
MAMLYKTDGTIEEVKPRSGSTFELEELQKFVGGYVESVRTVDGQMMLVNELGKMKKLDLNIKATRIYQHGRHDPIVGPALVVSRSEMS